tara:strand:- start:8458 stop:9561 length:1104 start_codon:yes stop_codon:yes gene_type:complete
MFKSLNDIPYVVFINYVINYLEIKEVGVLSMTSKRLNEIFDNNEIWKMLYSRTRELKITDNSVHINYYVKNGKRIMNEEPPTYWWPLTQQKTNSFIKGDFTGTGCLCKIKSHFFNSFLPLCVIASSHPEYKETRFVQEQTQNVQKMYYEYCKSKHRDINKYEGLSTVNLCRNTDHYIPETLEREEIKVNHKSFKKITLEKMNTKIKSDIKKKTRDLVKNENELKLKKNKLKQELEDMKKLEYSIISDKKKLDKDNNFKTKSDLTIGLINKELYPQKQKQISKMNDAHKQVLAEGFHKTPAEWQAKYKNMPNPPGTMGFSSASGMNGWIPKPEDRWYRIYSKEYNEYYYHNFYSKKSEWKEPKYWLDY